MFYFYSQNGNNYCYFSDSSNILSEIKECLKPQNIANESLRKIQLNEKEVLREFQTLLEFKIVQNLSKPSTPSILTDVRNISFKDTIYQLNLRNDRDYLIYTIHQVHNLISYCIANDDSLIIEWKGSDELMPESILKKL